jgi:hypothetical protein
MRFPPPLVTAPGADWYGHTPLGLDIITGAASPASIADYSSNTAKHVVMEIYI